MIWDWPLLTAATQCREGFVYVDIGANIGASLLGVGAVRPDASLVAVEASARFGWYLLANANQPGLRERTALRLAFVGEESTVRNLVVGSTSASAAGREGVRGICSEEIALAPVSLDALVADLPSLDLLKIDVDGLEADVVSSGLSVLTRYRPTLFVEFTPSRLAAAGSSGERLFGLLGEAGYARADVFAPSGALITEGVRLPDVEAVQRRSGSSYVDLLVRD
ncbi:MAG: FkbM family methyltransferase [Acidimicrobiales bacterium]|nr:FkbM family methyltransferase [Acidimicrobiales bacterium]